MCLAPHDFICVHVLAEIHALHSNTCSLALSLSHAHTHKYLHTLTDSIIHSPRAFIYSSKFLLSLRFHVPTKASAIFDTTACTMRRKRRSENERMSSGEMEKDGGG